MIFENKNDLSLWKKILAYKSDKNGHLLLEIVRNVAM